MREVREAKGEEGEVRGRGGGKEVETACWGGGGGFWHSNYSLQKIGSEVFAVGGTGDGMGERVSEEGRRRGRKAGVICWESGGCGEHSVENRVGKVGEGVRCLP